MTLSRQTRHTHVGTCMIIRVAAPQWGQTKHSLVSGTCVSKKADIECLTRGYDATTDAFFRSCGGNRALRKKIPGGAAGAKGTQSRGSFPQSPALAASS